MHASMADSDTLVPAVNENEKNEKEKELILSLSMPPGDDDGTASQATLDAPLSEDSVIDGYIQSEQSPKDTKSTKRRKKRKPVIMNDYTLAVSVISSPVQRQDLPDFIKGKHLKTQKDLLEALRINNFDVARFVW